MAHTAIVLGAGVGGIVTANELRERCAKTDRIILIDRNAMHLFAPSLLWLVAGSRTANEIQRPVRELLRPGIEFVQGTVLAIDPAQRAVTTDGARFTTDALVVALGAELAPDTIPGLAEAGHNFYTLDGAQSLRHALEEFHGGKVVVMTASALYKCPAAPYEAALLIEDALRKRGVRAATTMEMHAAEPAPMGVAGPAVSEALKAVLRSKGIAYSSNHQVMSVDPASHIISFADRSSTTYDLLAYVPPHRPPAVIAESGLAGDVGWIPVNRSTLGTSFEGVYAIGDVATIPLSMGKPLPKAGVFAHAEAAVVARNIADSWRLQPTKHTFNGHGACFVETGDGKAAIGSGNFFADPTPMVTLRPPSFVWHFAKVLLEKRWLKRWRF
ncbi:MAG: NAD(P)/FAD-dependent oxidoreductase [Vulcanimicrobiaceae bacterium]